MTAKGGNKITEGDVEFRVIHTLLTENLRIPESSIRSKEHLEPTIVDKRGGKPYGYFPDFSVWEHSLPVLIIEAKAPSADVYQGFREATLYAHHLNKQYRSGLNPCQRILATNGTRILAGMWDGEPVFDAAVKDVTPGSAALAQLQQFCGQPILIDCAKKFATALRPKKITAPYELSGGRPLLNAKKTPNTFAAPLSPVLRKYFSSKQKNTDPEIYERAYINNSELTSYDKTLDTLLREKIVELRGSLSRTLKPGKRSEQSVASVIRAFHEHATTGDLQLITGGVGSGKSLFIRRYKELLQSPEQQKVTHWAFIDFNNAPKDLQKIEDWLCEQFVASFAVENGFDARESENWKKVFAVDINRKQGLYKEIEANSPEQATRLRWDDLTKWSEDPQKMAVGLARFFLGDCNETVVVVMDNVDRLEKDDQLQVFRLSLWFMDQTRSFVFLNLRDDTYEAYKDEKPLDTYRSGITFHVSPPPFVDVVKRRLELSGEYLVENIHEKLEYTTSSGLRFTYPKTMIGEFLKEIYIQVFDQFQNVSRVIQGLAGRDVRAALEIFERILRSGHLSEEAITSKVRGGSEFAVTEDVILKTVMRGDYKFYSQNSGFVANIFHTEDSWERPSNFLVPDILFWLYVNRKSLGKIGLEGYFTVIDVARALELRGYVAEDVFKAIGYLLKSGLVEADHFGSQLLTMDDSVKVTSSGFIHLRILAERLEYVFGISPVTPLPDRRAVEAISKIIDVESNRGDVPESMKIQAAAAMFGVLREDYTKHVSSYPAFSNPQSGAAYVLNRLEDVVSRSRARTPPPVVSNPLDFL